MLEVQFCARPEDKREFFKTVDLRKSSWVVSDLQSKWHLQKRVLEENSVLEERSVMRATELWKHFAFQLKPELHILSPELAQTLFWTWLEPMNLPWARSPQAVPVLINQMQMWMSIFADPQHEDLMAQWFTENPESYVRWGHWFELCSEIWKRCQERELVLMSWLPAVLLNEDLSELKWSRPMVVDLGPQISQVEGLLLRELGRGLDVTVLVPEAPWIGLMRNALKSYDVLVDKKDDGDPEWQPQVNQSFSFGRFSTQLAEVKDAVATVRAWLDSGIEPSCIAIVAPDIEEYWPALNIYLAEEGVAVSKPLTSRLGSYPEMAQWLATLRTALKQISAEDLQVHFFTSESQPRLDFNQFRVLFSNVYDAGDLNRARELFSGLTPVLNEAQSIHDFLAWALSFWKASAAPERLLAFLQSVGREVPRALMLKPQQWLSYCEGLFARRELQLQAGDESGIWCVSISSSAWLDTTHAVVLNLSEGALRRFDNSPVTASEAQKIFVDTGFALGTTDRQEQEFEFLWFLQREWQELKLSFAGTDFQGAVLTPAKLWMWAAFLNDSLKKLPEMPLTTRLDEIQHLGFSAMEKLRQWPVEHAEGLSTGLGRDRTNLPATWDQSREMRISASSLERFWDCPFIFAAQRKLKLSDDPVLDLDLDRRTRGALLHALAEELLSEPLQLEREDDELNALIEAMREKHEVKLGDDRFWPSVRAQHLRLAKLFLQFEREWRERFPGTVTAGRELAFECYWDLENGKPVAEKTTVTLAGRLDRVDRDAQGRYALIDYKASSNNFTNWNSWMRNREIQLALYASLLENGLMELTKGPVVAANYYVIKDSDRRKGYHLRDEAAELYSSADKHRNFISSDEKAALFASLFSEIQEALLKIGTGELNPNPIDTQICADCSWRTLCRAPHLN